VLLVERAVGDHLAHQRRVARQRRRRRKQEETGHHLGKVTLALVPRRLGVFALISGADVGDLEGVDIARRERREHRAPILVRVKEALGRVRQRRITVLIVELAAAGVLCERLVDTGKILKLLCRRRALVPVRVVLQRQTLVRLRDFLHGGRLGNAEDLIKVLVLEALGDR
jgi:hypothetical protein